MKMHFWLIQVRITFLGHFGPKMVDFGAKMHILGLKWIFGPFSDRYEGKI
jgi:hypothetical protein